MGISCRTNKTRRNLKVFVSGWADYIDPTIEDLELPDGEACPIHGEQSSHVPGSTTGLTWIGSSKWWTKGSILYFRNLADKLFID